MNRTIHKFWRWCSYQSNYNCWYVEESVGECSQFSKSTEKVSNSQEFFSFNHASWQLDNVSFCERRHQLSPNASAWPLDIHFKNFLKCGTIPSILKEAFVVPVHKSWARSTTANFRPVSLTSYVKTLEKVIRKTLINHLEVQNKLNPA